MISVVDYDVGNLGSIVNMFKKAGCPARLATSADEVREASRLVLPGVGAYDTGVAALEERGLADAVRERADAGIPVLGICLGMQLLFEGSEEGERSGLGLIRGRCVRFRPKERHIKIPHMGWNVVTPTSSQCLFREMDDDARFYFVHSYHAVCEDDAAVLGYTIHGVEFASAVRVGNVFGAQFHPEKSHRHGMRFLSNFASVEPC